MSHVLKQSEERTARNRVDIHRNVRHLDLFSGIGGFALAAEWAGWETIGFSEVDEYANKVLYKHWPNVINYGDIRNIEKIECDIITGGFPCQPFSVAGSQKAQEDDRHLWPQMLRVIKQCRPTWVLAENVPGLVKLGLDNVQSDLETEGYTSRAIIIPACAVGANHRRDRVWILAYTASDGRNEIPIARSNEAPDGECEKRAFKNRHDEGCGSLRTRVERRGNPKGEWRTESPTIRVDDGIPHRMDRNRVLGNAISPQVAYKFMEWINGSFFLPNQ